MAMPTSFPNMSVPGALSPAGLGLGDLLGGQVREETEEQRRKRLEQERTGALSPALAQLMSLGLGGLR
jgi:hypothetical protein